MSLHKYLFDAVVLALINSRGPEEDINQPMDIVITASSDLFKISLFAVCTSSVS